MRHLTLNLNTLRASLLALSALVGGARPRMPRSRRPPTAHSSRAARISRKPATASRAIPRRAARRSRAA